jgi:hypothetical protein
MEPGLRAQCAFADNNARRPAMQSETRTNAAHMETLSKLNQDYITSVQKSDVRRFEELLSEDFLNSNPDGTLVDRAQFLAQIGKLAAVSNLACEDVRIRILGNFAIIHARTTYQKLNGEPGAGRYTDIWALRDGRWVCVAAHVTRA